MSSLIKSAVPANSFGIWILGALFALNVCLVTGGVASAPSSEIVLASAE